MIKKIIISIGLLTIVQAESPNFWKYQRTCDGGKYSDCILAGNELALDGNYYKAQRFYNRGCAKGDKNACALSKASSKIYINSPTIDEDKALVVKLIKKSTIQIDKKNEKEAVSAGFVESIAQIFTSML